MVAFPLEREVASEMCDASSEDFAWRVQGPESFPSTSSRPALKNTLFVSIRPSSRLANPRDGAPYNSTPSTPVITKISGIIDRPHSAKSRASALKWLTAFGSNNTPHLASVGTQGPRNGGVNISSPSTPNLAKLRGSLAHTILVQY